ncbi:MAG: hypothetical protein ACQETL_09700 [Bacteroidota bacterium]
MMAEVTAVGFRDFGGILGRVTESWRKNGRYDLTTFGNIGFNYTQTPLGPDLFGGTGVEANLYIGLGTGVSVDRIQDANGGNDLYFTWELGVGADVSLGTHGSFYDVTPGPENIAGGSYFWSGAYGPLSYQRSGTIVYDSETGFRFGDYYQNQIGAGVGSPYLVGGAKAGLSYTVNLSDIARFFQGYQTRSYHE